MIYKELPPEIEAMVRKWDTDRSYPEIGEKLRGLAWDFIRYLYRDKGLDLTLYDLRSRDGDRTE